MPLGLTKKILNESVLTDSFDRRSFVLGVGGLSVGILLAASTGIVGATVTQGGSGWGANAHVPALHALPNYELKAVCTAHEDTAKASAKKFGFDLAFHDMGEMVAHPDVDLVTVVVRVPWHKDLVMQAIDAKKPVCCEWPLGAHVAEAAEMADAA